jgi:branched-subunit amino acid transport protein
MLPFMRGMLLLYPLTVPVGVLIMALLFATVLFGAYRAGGVQVRWPMVFAGCVTGAAASALARFVITLIVVFVIRKAIPAESFLDN